MSMISVSVVIDFHLQRKLVRLPALNVFTLCCKLVIILGKRDSNLLTSSITVCNVAVRLTWCPPTCGVGSTTFSCKAGSSCAGLKKACCHCPGGGVNYYPLYVCSLASGSVPLNWQSYCTL